MATDLDEKDLEDKENPIQKHFDDTFNEMTSPKNYVKDAQEPKTLNEQESKPDGGGGLDSADKAETDRIGGQFGYQQDESPLDSKEGLKKLVKGAFAGRRKYGWIGGGIGVVGLIITSFFTLSLELVHIKERVDQEIGAISDTVQGSRSHRVYNRMFFFRDDGKFDGYKEKGMFGFIQNRSSTRLLDEMRANGFEVEPEMRDGRWTGRILSISQDGVELASLDGNREFSRRGAINHSLDQLYPDKSRFWRALQARKLYARYNLNYLRGGWLRDTNLFRNVENFELNVRKTMREALFGESRNNGVNLSGAAGEGATAEETKLTGDLQEIAGNSEQAAQELLDDPSLITEEITDVDYNAAKIISSVPGTAVTGVIRGINLFGAIDSACEVKRFAGLVKAGATVHRNRQLISFAVLFFSAADAQKAGQLESRVLGGLMGLLRQNSDGKSSLYSGGAWDWLGNKSAVIDPIDRDHYSVAGGFSGPLGVAAAIADNELAGANCGFFGNFFVQIGGFLLGAIVGVFSLGTFTVANIAANLSLTFAFEIIKIIAAPQIGEFLTDTLITWDENGDQYMSALVSGTGALYAANGANHGMKPLTVDEYVYLKNEADTLEQERYASKPLLSRLFDVNDVKSVISNIAMSLPRSINEIKVALTDFVSSPFAMVAENTFPLLANKSVVYAQAVSQCEDQLILDNGLATDPFCNPIYGEDVAGLAIEPDDNFIYMWEEGYVNDDGVPQGPYVEFVERCVNNVSDYYKYNDTSGGFDYDDYCMQDDVITQNFRAFSSYYPMVQAIGDELNNQIGAPGYAN